ncbi:hypothetical protein [Clostridium estertheticum]|uniref:hypothetical protein n=1 Tax=Clostridium estertheticum TaxID=238834 RepID=UPI001CF239C1|nr:hypothetical protein [Clostridium estertheticum]MCB2341112.1 hypothetical protein [Clostridium estertheticum]
MNEINSKYYSEKIYRIFEQLLNEFELIGKRIWGNPGGQSVDRDTFEVKNDLGTLWCSTIKWVRSGTSEINRKGIVATFPVKTNSETLGQIVEITIPFEFKRIFNNRAYGDEEFIEIRNYGKFTVGRSGIKKKDFFDFITLKDRNLINIDEENKEYITVFEIENGSMTKEEFSNSLVKFTCLIKEFKDGYRVKGLD